MKNKLNDEDIQKSCKKEPQIDLNRAKTYKIPTHPEINEEDEIENFSKRKKYSYKFKDSKEINDSDKISGGGATMNSTSGTYKQKDKKIEEVKNEIKCFS